MILLLVLGLLSVVGAVTAWVEFHEVVRPVLILNPDRTRGSALVVYQQGLRDFQPKVAHAFARGLAATGWRVDLTTVSRRTPMDLAPYDLLVLSWPTYWFTPSLPLRRYLHRLGDLQGKPTVILCTAAGAPLGSCATMTRLVHAAHGTIVNAITLFTMRPHEGDEDPVVIATRTATAIPLP